MKLKVKQNRDVIMINPQNTQIEAIANSKSYYEQTNISGSSSKGNPNFYVEAYQNLGFILEN